MIKDCRKMNDFRSYLRKLLEKEFYTSEILNTKVEAGEFLHEDFVELCEKHNGNRLIEYNIVELDKDVVMNNPYLKNIKISICQQGDVCLARRRFIPARTLIMYDEKLRNLDHFNQINSYCWCQHDVRFPALIDEVTGVCWMSVEPYEISTSNKFIESASGNVLLLGCGLGYFAYMLSLKNNVNKITIVDNNPNVIKLFQEKILCQFEQKDKIELVQSDALEYMYRTNLSTFDFVNVDIWRDVQDMVLTYLPCLEIEKKYPNTSFYYWDEGAFKEAIQKNVIGAACGFDKLFEGEIIRRIGEDIVQQTPINSREDFQKLLKFDNLREILLEWYLNNKVEFEDLKKSESKHIDDIMETTKVFTKSK